MQPIAMIHPRMRSHELTRQELNHINMRETGESLEGTKVPNSQHRTPGLPPSVLSMESLKDLVDITVYYLFSHF